MKTGDKTVKVWTVAVDEKEREREKKRGIGRPAWKESLVWRLVRLQKLLRESVDLVGAPDLVGEQR